MSVVPRRILVTSALPYANGSIHLGHLVEYIQTDIWVRFQRLRGNEVTYVCGDDAHGTPIMIKAKSQHTDPKTFINRMNAEHKADFAKFGVAFDNFYTTDSPENQALTEAIYAGLKAKGHIATKEVEQLFDPVENIFLADRFVKGTCPVCKAEDQDGDACVQCGKTYDPTELINPRSIFSGATPVLKKTSHLVLRLENFRKPLLELYERGFVDESMRKKLLEWFSGELRDWDFTRDDPFWGFAIPGAPGKRFYNWFDAPIGYLASLANLKKLTTGRTREYWADPELEIYHFIGKDIPYFHGIFWPCMLLGGDFRLPTALRVHGFLTVDGAKMSKSRGTFINAGVYAKHCDPQWLRYYYATKLTAGQEDLDLSMEDFVNRVNSELVGKLANLISRSKMLMQPPLDGRTGVPAMDALPILNAIRAAEEPIAKAYEAGNFAAATRQICALADQMNKYFDEQAPWKLVKAGEEGVEEARGVLTATLEAGRILTIYLKAVLPEFAAKVEKCLRIEPLEWKHVHDAMEPHGIAPFEHLAVRIERKQVDAMIEESKESLGQKAEAGSKKSEEKPGASSQKPVEAAPVAPGAGVAPMVPAGAGAAAVTAPGMHPAEEVLAAQCNIDQFLAVDLRVAKILTAEAVEKSEKLLRIRVDLGFLGQRTVLAGIKKAYTPESLVGRLVIICANLAPRTMGKFGTSEGMILAAGPGGAEIYVLSPESGAKPGQRVH